MINNPLPFNWITSTIGETSPYIQRGKSPKYTQNSELAVINQKCIRWNQLQTEHQKYIHPSQIAAWDSNRYIRQGDILWNSTGTGTVGRAYLVKSNDSTSPKVVDSHVTIVRASQEVDPRIIFYWIKGPCVQNRIEELCEGSTNQVELSRAAISEVKIPLPPINEQRRIADKLDRVLARIDAANEHLSRVAPLIKRFRQSVLAAATSGRLTEDWRKNKLQEWKFERADAICAKVQSGGTPKAGFSPQGTPFLKVYNIVNQRIDFDYKPQFIAQEVHEGELKKSITLPDDVLMNIVGPPLGKVAIVSSTSPSWNINQAITLFRPSERILSKWIYIVLCEGTPIRSVLKSTKGSVGQVNISLSQCRAFSIPVPSIEEQSEIVRRVEKLFAFADHLEERLSQAQTAVQKLTPALLAKAFRGELVPQDPNDEPASELLKRLQESRANDTITRRARKPRATSAVEPS